MSGNSPRLRNSHRQGRNSGKTQGSVDISKGRVRFACLVVGTTIVDCHRENIEKDFLDTSTTCPCAIYDFRKRIHDRGLLTVRLGFRNKPL